MTPSADLINMARDRCVDEVALLEALDAGQIAGAGLDSFEEEPLPVRSPRWDRENVIITPHTGGETRRYEANVVDILPANRQRLEDDQPLIKQVI